MSTDGHGRRLRRMIEQAAVIAWPALETQDVDGWLWRASGGGSQRANSVSTLDHRGGDVEASIDRVEELYRLRGAVRRVQVALGISVPADLDERLARRGYRIVDPVTTLLKPCTMIDWPTDVERSDWPGEDWLAIYLENISPDRRPFAAGVLRRVPPPAVFVLARRAGEPVSTALGVVHEDVVIAECVGTRGGMRRRGGASLVMQALEVFGREHGASHIALQAVADNQPAQALYRGLGYREVGRSHYRVLD